MKFIVLNIYTLIDIRKEEIAKKFYKLIVKYGYTPDKIGIVEPLKKTFNVSNLADTINMWMHTDSEKYHTFSGTVILLKKKPRILFMAHWIKGKNAEFNWVSIDISERFLANGTELNKFIKFINEMYKLFNPILIYSSHDDVKEQQIRIVTVDERGWESSRITGTIIECIPGIFWLNYFGPVFVDFVGRDKFKNAPCYKKEEMPDGGYMLMTAEDPFNPNDQMKRKAEQDLKEYFGLEYFGNPKQPGKKCKMPDFDFSDLRGDYKELTPEEEKNQILEHFKKTGLELVEEEGDGTLVFRSKRGKHDIVKFKKGSIDYFKK